MAFETFYHNGKQYGAGTEVLFTGLCYIKGQTVFLKNEKCIFKGIAQGSMVVFNVNEEEAWCDMLKFEKSIRLDDGRDITETQEELYLSNKSFYKLLWYIIIMIVGVLFYDRWLIWIGATIVFIVTTPEVKQFLKGGK